MNIKNDFSFDEKGLIPAIIQEQGTGKVLMLAYMNEESLKLTLSTGTTHFYSRTRQALWRKGETSGHIQIVKSIKKDCDDDALLVTVEQVGPACHTGEKSCFYKDVVPGVKSEAQSTVLNEVYEVLLDRKRTRPEGSYTAKLFKEGLDRILKKIGEEASEVILASKNDVLEDIVHETADLWFHSLMVLSYHEIEPEKIFQELLDRREGGKSRD